MGYRVQYRRDTAARWAEINPILLDGEIGYVKDNPNQYKMGDGVHRWNDLPLRGFDGTIAPTLGYDDNAVLSQRIVTEKFEEQNEKITELGSELTQLNGNWFTISGYIDGNGGFVSSSTRKCTDLINVKGISSVRVKGGSNEFNVALYALYDENKNFISSASGSQYDKKLIEVDIPDEAHFIRCTSDENGNGEYYGVSFLTIEREIGRIKESVNNNEKSINDNSEAIKNIPSELGFEPIITDYSVLELNNITLSVYGSPSMWDNGKIVTLSSTSYRMAVNEKIPVHGGQTYKASILLGDAYTSMLVHFWNSKTNQFTQQDVNSSTLEFATPDWCDTVMFTINKFKASDIANLDVTTYGDTGYYRNDKLVIENKGNSGIKKLCDGKKIILFGDSQLGQGRDYPSEKTNISVLLQDIVGGKVYNWGFGGCSMALRETPSTWDAFSMVSIADAVVSGDYSTQDDAAMTLASDIPYATTILSEMKAENFADGENMIFFIAYGGNDYNNLCKLGDAASFDTKTYRGAINYSAKKLMSAFPKAKICLCGVAYRVFSYTSKTEQGITSDSDSTYNIVVENGSNQHYYRYTYNDALIEQGKHLHIPTFDKYYRAGRNRYNVWTLCPNDGIHPESLVGRQAEADFYVGALRTII